MDMLKMNPKIEVGKKYKTRDGRDVRIYSVEKTGVHSIHGAYATFGSWAVASWSRDGRFDASKEETILDIVVDDIADLRSECRQYREALVDVQQKTCLILENYQMHSPLKNNLNDIVDRISRGLSYGNNE